MAYKCSVKDYGTVLYRYGVDILHALNIALGQARNFSPISNACSTEEQFQKNLSETCHILNIKFHDNIKRLIQEDATSPHGIENLNIDTFIKDLDPDIWKAVCMLTEPLSFKAKKGTDHSNKVRKIRRFFSTCVLFFVTNSQCCFPIHTVLADAIETCGGSSRLQKLMNRLGACCSIDTHDRYINQAGMVYTSNNPASTTRTSRYSYTTKYWIYSAKSSYSALTPVNSPAQPSHPLYALPL